MRATSLGLATLLGLLWAPQARAAEVDASIGLVSDYRFRGISLSDGRPAVQASIEAALASGLYGGAWASSIKEDGSGTAAEVQLYAGYELAVTEQLSLDVSANYYAYPGDWGFNYVETTAVARAQRGDLSVGLGYNFVPQQGGTRDDGGRHPNHYLFAEAAYEVPGAPLTLTTSAGYERGYFDAVAGGGKWDWSLGAEAKLACARLGLHYTGSDAPGHHSTVVASLLLDL